MLQQLLWAVTHLTGLVGKYYIGGVVYFLRKLGRINSGVCATCMHLCVFM